MTHPHPTLFTNPSSRFVTSGAYVAAPDQTAHANRQRALVVDDEKLNRSMLCRILKHHGVDSAQAISGIEAVQLIDQETFDLVLLDISMPEMDGFDTLIQIRQRFDASELPVIMVTAASNRNDVLKAFEFGANDYLTKPVDAGITGARVKTQLKLLAARAALRESQQRYALAALGSRDGIWDWNFNTGQVFYSARWKTMLGLAESYPANTPEAMFDRIHPDDSSQVQQLFDRHIDGETPHFETELRVRHESNSYRWMLFRGLAVRNDDDTVQRVAGSLTDITEGKVADALTGLPNRLMFNEQVERCLDRYRRDTSKLFCVMYLDIDNFKLVNDSHGHEAGDHLLLAVSHRMTETLRSSDAMLARLGGDEFAILVQNIHDDTTPALVAQQILRALAQPCKLACGQEVFAGISIGTSIVSNRCVSKEDILREADTAMYQAKANGKNCSSVYDPGMHERIRRRLTTETELRTAVEHQNFVLHFQPVVDLSTHDVIGVESLIRWNHPTRGLIMPIEFISIAEDTGLIIPIGRWVVEESCRILHSWRNLDERFGSLQLNFNVSTKQFSDTDLLPTLRKTLNDYPASKSQLGFEITESLLTDRPELAAALLNEVRELGVRIAIDDFGTGYSSLACFQQYPLDELKVDQSFVQRIDVNSNRAIIRAIKGLADGLELQMIGEGIETKEQLSVLTEIGCRFGQGILFSQPLPAADLAEKLIANDFRLKTSQPDSFV